MNDINNIDDFDDFDDMKSNDNNGFISMIGKGSCLYSLVCIFNF